MNKARQDNEVDFSRAVKPETKAKAPLLETKWDKERDAECWRLACERAPDELMTILFGSKGSTGGNEAMFASLLDLILGYICGAMSDSAVETGTKVARFMYDNWSDLHKIASFKASDIAAIEALSNLVRMGSSSGIRPEHLGKMVSIVRGSGCVPAVRSPAITAIGDKFKGTPIERVVYDDAEYVQKMMIAAGIEDEVLRNLEQLDGEVVGDTYKIVIKLFGNKTTAFGKNKQTARNAAIDGVLSISGIKDGVLIIRNKVQLPESLRDKIKISPTAKERVKKKGEVRCRTAAKTPPKEPGELRTLVHDSSGSGVPHEPGDGDDEIMPHYEDRKRKMERALARKDQQNNDFG